MIEAGFSKAFNFDGVKAVSFDYRTVPAAPRPAMLYIDLAVSITLTKTHTYYNKGENSTKGILEDSR